MSEKSGPSVKLVIFDCDGVLVDSEPIENALLAQALRDEGLNISTNEATRRFVGATMPQVVEEAEILLDQALPDDFLDRLQEKTFEAFRKSLKAVPGAVEAVKKVRSRKIAFCVASNGDLDKMAVSLGVTGLAPLFSGRTFSHSQVPRGKPHPDLFLFAARKMGVPPDGCLVIEDSVSGIKAALAAGMGVLRFAPEDGASPANDTVPIIRSLDEIDDWLG